MQDSVLPPELMEDNNRKYKVLPLKQPLDASPAQTLTSHLWWINQDEPRKGIGDDYRFFCLLTPGILWMNPIFRITFFS